jgi:hypothetical protein
LAPSWLVKDPVAATESPRAPASQKLPVKVPEISATRSEKGPFLAIIFIICCFSAGILAMMGAALSAN